MSTIPLHDAQARLADLIHGLSPGQVLTITENDRPVARLVPVLVVRQRSPTSAFAGDRRAQGRTV